MRSVPTRAVRSRVPHRSHLLVSLPAPAPASYPSLAASPNGLNVSGAKHVVLHRSPTNANPPVGCGADAPASGLSHAGLSGSSRRSTGGSHRASSGLPGPPPPDPAALTSWIKSVRCISSLLRLVRQYGDRMNHIHVSAAVSHLSQLASRHPTVAAILAEAAAMPAPPPSPGLGGVVDSGFGSGTLSPSAAALDASAGTVPAPAPSSRAAESRVLMDSLLLLTTQQLQAYEPRQLANTAWALGKWPPQLPGRGRTLAAIVQEVGPVLGRLKPQELANLLHGCAACSADAEGGTGGDAGAPADEFLSEHAWACAAKLRQGPGPEGFKMQELSNLLWAWGTLLGSSDDRGSASSSPEAAGPAFGASGAQGGSAAAVPRVAVPYRHVLSAQLRLGLVRAQPQELANSLLPSAEWFAAFLDAVHRQLHATGREGLPPSHPDGSAFGQATSISGGSAAGFSPQELSNLLWGCSKLRLRLPPFLLDAVGPALERCLPAMNLAERVNVLSRGTAAAGAAAAGPSTLPAAADHDGDDDAGGCGGLSPSLLRRVVSSVVGVALRPVPPPGPPSPGSARPSPAPHASSPEQHKASASASVFKPQDVSMALWSLATLAQEGLGGCATGPGLSGRPSGSSGGAAIAGAPWARAGAGLDPGEAVVLLEPSEAEALLHLWGRCLPAMAPQSLSNCVWAASRLGLSLPVELQPRLTAWLRRHAAALAPAEAAAVLRGLGGMAPGLAPSPELAPAVAAVLEAALRAVGGGAAAAGLGSGARCGLWELVQMCYGAALLLRCMNRWHVRAALEGGWPAAADDSVNGSGGGDGAGIRPAALDVRMSIDLEEDGVWGSPATGESGAVPAAVQQQQWRLAAPLDRLILQLQVAYDRDAAAAAAAAVPPPWGLDELGMTVATVGIVVPAHVGETRGSELAAWSEDLVRTHVRRALLAELFV
ncbi:hypothetical protein GPECTOR_36g48 [Gonium pectorale]|uniref:RAP domain-containing protein n=1 Tax=Gonium pectorale TaxID=33097 RepID=A0A150GBW2_GONPE|nr:hypothetical protein GPECTOR_36g48 [Gonium pectorale]|eukprot:KXZ47324.1 hypothetical protein GPECTOR_36g48 [Gonium pectorale]